MKKTRTSKQALLLSVLSLLMCISMLVGSTMAWFTDSVTSTGNKIQAGTLELDLKLFNGRTYESIKTSKAPIFNYEKWEPGYTDVKLLKIENNGTLALKWYAKFVSTNAVTKLADVIDVYVCPSEQALTMPTNRDLTGYTRVGTVREFINTIETTTNGVLNGNSSAYLGIALKMQETAGNEYQDLAIGAFDILILATQATVEEDIFNDQYDADAKYPFELWDGTTVTPPAQDADGVYHITNAAELVAMMNDSKYPNCNKYQNVVLENNIDLGGRTVSGFGDDSGFFDGIFDGQGYTISNFKIDASNRNYYAGLFNQVSQYSGENTVIKNLTVANATIIGTSQVGAIVGGMNGNTVVDNCKAIDCTLIGVKKVGSVVGYTAGGTVTNNYAENCTVLYSEKEGEEILGYENTGSTVNNNTANNVTVQQGFLVSTEAALVSALKNATADSIVVFANDIVVNRKWDNRYDGGKMSVPVTIDGDGHTLKIVGPVDDAGNQQAVFYFQNDAVVKNLTFDLSEATSTFQGRVRAIASKADIVVDNCTFIGNSDCTRGNGVTFGMGSGADLVNVDVTVTNCTFIDLPRALYDNEGGKDAKTLTITDNKFVNSGINVSAGESITFTGNELVNSDVRLVSYQNGDTVKVTATDNDLTASAGKVIAIVKVTNAANITKQDEFIVY